MDSTMIADRIHYDDRPGHRALDIRPDGIDCIPLLGCSSFPNIRDTIGFHYHPGCMEFCLCLKGNLVFDTVDGREYPFMPGHIFVSSPTQPHHLRSCPSGLKVYTMLFRIPTKPARLLGLDMRGSEWLSRSLTHMPKRLFASIPSVRTAFERLFETYDTVSSKSPSRRVKMRAAALDLLLALVEAARRPPSKAPGIIREIADRIRETPDADYPLDQMAKEANMSVAAFTATFKLASGLPLHAYMLHCRVNKAKRLLTSTNRTVSSIGHELRFYSTQHFARTFKRIVGCTPTEFASHEHSQ